MLVLFETALGYGLFKVLKEDLLKGDKIDTISGVFETLNGASKAVQLKAFSKFADTTEALESATTLNDAKLPSSLGKFLKKNIVSKDLKDELAVADKTLGGLIKEKYSIPCVYSSAVLELIRGIRNQLEGLLEGVSADDLKTMALGLSHSMSRYSLKFSPDKVDTMIVQAIHLLDDLDKELNTYTMRLREWYGWHFPEVGKIITDNSMFVRTIRKMGLRKNAQTMDFSDILPSEIEQELKDASVISMGTDISQQDLDNINALADQILSLTEYRIQLFDYLKNRMNAIAPNLTVMVGEMVGARLIAHAGSLVNLAKYPASTVQILGAEKALFRALKTKKETPKYGLIFHASLIGQAPPKHKGKIARLLAAKCSLSIRCDALSDAGKGAKVGVDCRAKVEERIRNLESSGRVASGGSGKTPKKTPKVEKSSTPAQKYNAVGDSTLGSAKAEKRKREESSDESSASAEPAKKKKAAAKKDSDSEDSDASMSSAPKKDKKDKKDKKEKKEKKESKDTKKDKESKDDKKEKKDKKSKK